jgi:hypothetical protein
MKTLIDRTARPPAAKSQIDIGPKHREALRPVDLLER